MACIKAEKWICFLFAVGSQMAVGLCSTANAESVLHIVASTSIMADVVREVGGTHVNVKSIVPIGTDPHTYEPRPEESVLVAGADIVFISSLGLESWFGELAEGTGYDLKPIIISSGIKPREFLSVDRVIIDPHVWNDPENVVIWVDRIQQALSKARPEAAADFASAAARYVKELRDLDAYGRKQFASLRGDRRSALTVHDSLGYLGAEYGLHFLSAAGVSTATPFTLQDAARLGDLARAAHARVYFTESTTDPAVVAQAGRASAAAYGGELYVDSLSGEDGPAQTYIKMMRYNIDRITAALGN